MKDVKIKILKDTPFDVEGIEISLSDFRQKYRWVCSRYASDKELVEYLEQEERLQAELPYPGNVIAKWFQVIHPPKFQVGDWVWHEDLKRAYCVTRDAFNDWRPHYVSLAAVNEFPNIYKRKATPEEISRNDLYLCCDGQVLIGREKSYYFNNIWREIKGVHKAVNAFINITNAFEKISDGESEYHITPLGLKIGCKTIEYNEIIKVAKFLKLIP